MIRTYLKATALVAMLALSATSAHAETTYTERYTGGAVGVPGVAGGRHVATGDPDVGGIGGAAFFGFDGVPTSLEINDTTGGPVHVTIAQSTDGDTTYGEAGEPRVAGCGKTFDLTTSAVPFESDYQVIVFMYVAHQNTATSCGGGATHGSVTLTTNA